MIINKNEFDLHYLALQVLSSSPEIETASFKNGYATFVECFFLDLDFCSDGLVDDQGKFEVDLDLTIKLTLRGLKALVSKLPESYQAAQWQGIQQAALSTERILRLAFDENLNFQAA